jgi:AcrR family transcriptional regulator
MNPRISEQAGGGKPLKDQSRPKRADAVRKMDDLLKAAMEIFEVSGVHAPVREIAERAGVGLGTVYRHFPQRSDLIAAVFQSRADACAKEASALARNHPPGEALIRWMRLYVDFIASKPGLATVLYSSDPAYSALPVYFNRCLEPALAGLLISAVSAKLIRPGIDAADLLCAVATLCSGPNGEEPAYARRMVELLVNGLFLNKS